MPHGLVPTDLLWPQKQSESQPRFIWVDTLAKPASWSWAQMFLLAWDKPIWDCTNLSCCQFLTRTLFYFIKMNRLLPVPCLGCQIHISERWIRKTSFTDWLGNFQGYIFVCILTRAQHELFEMGGVFWGFCLHGFWIKRWVRPACIPALLKTWTSMQEVSTGLKPYH